MSITMALLNPPSVLIATSVGLCLSTSFSMGSLALTNFAIPAILLPADAPLMPPLELVAEKKKRPAHTEQAPKQPFDSGVGDTKESILDTGSTSKALRQDGDDDTGSPSTSSYLLRQWFHLFSKGMHSLPPLTLGSGALYIYCAVASPGPGLDMPMDFFTAKRAMYLAAASLSAGAMVFTLTALKPINTALHELVQEVVEEEGKITNSHNASKDQYVHTKRKETEVLIRKWGKMNAQRALLPIAAAVCAAVALTM